MPAPHHSFFTGQILFLPPNQQHQSPEGTRWKEENQAESGLLRFMWKVTVTMEVWALLTRDGSMHQ